MGVYGCAAQRDKQGAGRCLPGIGGYSRQVHIACSAYSMGAGFFQYVGEFMHRIRFFQNCLSERFTFAPDSSFVPAAGS